MRAPFFGPEAWGPLARAWRAFVEGDTEGVIHVLTDEADPEPMPVALFFRSKDDLRPVDREALQLVRGRVLDGGAGVGCIALALQENGIRVTASEVVPAGAEIMLNRGVRNVKEGRLEDLPADNSYDTILLLMNGTALAGTLEGMPSFLETLEALLAPGGQVLLDSTDLLERGGWNEEDRGGDIGMEFSGEIQYQLEFRGSRGAPFPQLFLDPGTLAGVAGEEGWETEVVWQGEGGEYLARLTRR